MQVRLPDWALALGCSRSLPVPFVKGERLGLDDRYFTEHVHTVYMLLSQGYSPKYKATHMTKQDLQTSGEHVVLPDYICRFSRWQAGNTRTKNRVEMSINTTFGANTAGAKLKLCTCIIPSSFAKKGV